MPRFAPSSIPSRRAIAEERQRRAPRRLARILEKLARPEWPAWAPSADKDWQAWTKEHWSQAARDEFDTLQRRLYFEAIDSAMGAVALAVWELRDEPMRISPLLRGVALTPWSEAADAKRARLWRRDHWGAWESVYFERWYARGPLSPTERRRDHECSWREHLEAEASTVRALGACWWRGACGCGTKLECSNVDLAAGLRLAAERGHDRDYPRPAAEGGPSQGRDSRR